MISLSNTFDIFAVTIALICLNHARKNGKIILFFIALSYGLFIEEMGASGVRLTALIPGYTYGKDFFVIIWYAPLSIALMWASVIYSTMETSDRLNIYPSTRPFFDALTALLIDIPMEPVATKFGLWRWENSEGFLGIPFINFLGWMFVVFAFSLVFRILTKKLKVINLYYFLILFILFIPFRLDGLYVVKMMSLLSSIFIFLFIILLKNKLSTLHLGNPLDFNLLAVPVGFQGLFLLFLLLNKEYIAMFPVLLVLSIFALALSCIIYLMPSYSLIINKIESKNE